MAALHAPYARSLVFIPPPTYFVAPGRIEEVVAPWIDFSPNWIIAASPDVSGGILAYHDPSYARIEVRYYGTYFDLGTQTANASFRGDVLVSIDGGAPILITQRVASPYPNGASWSYFQAPRTMRRGLHTVVIESPAQPGVYNTFDYLDTYA